MVFESKKIENLINGNHKKCRQTNFDKRVFNIELSVNLDVNTLNIAHALHFRLIEKLN